MLNATFLKVRGIRLDAGRVTPVCLRMPTADAVERCPYSLCQCDKYSRRWKHAAVFWCWMYMVVEGRGVERPPQRAPKHTTNNLLLHYRNLKDSCSPTLTTTTTNFKSTDSIQRSLLLELCDVLVYCKRWLNYRTVCDGPFVLSKQLVELTVTKLRVDCNVSRLPSSQINPGA